MANFNLDSIIGKCVHRPIASNDPDKYPLYKRNDGAFDEVGGKQTSRSDAWKVAVEKHYSSPNNIRRIFITREGVYVHFFRPFSGAKDSTTREAFYKYSSINDKFNPMELYKAGDNRSAYKFGLGCLRDKWVCSNIEEIYFDWTLLLSRDLISLGLGNLIVDWTKGGNGKILPGDVLWAIFSRSCLKNGENISRIFPRLKVICYVNELNILYNAVKRKPGEESAQDLCTPWYKNAQFKAAVADRRFCVSLYKVPNVSAINMKYSTRSYYCFDTEKLEPYFASVVEKLGTYDKALKKSCVSNELYDAIEKNIGQIYKVYRRLGPKLALSTDGYSLEALKDIDGNSSYSEADKEKFKGVVGVICNTEIISSVKEACNRRGLDAKDIDNFDRYVASYVQKNVKENIKLDVNYVLRAFATAENTLLEMTIDPISSAIADFIGQICNVYKEVGPKVAFSIDGYSLDSVKNIVNNSNYSAAEKEKYTNVVGIIFNERVIDSVINLCKLKGFGISNITNVKKEVAPYVDKQALANADINTTSIVKAFMKASDILLEMASKNKNSSDIGNLLHTIEKESGLENAKSTLQTLLELNSTDKEALLNQLSPSDIERYKG